MSYPQVQVHLTSTMGVVRSLASVRETSKVPVKDPGEDWLTEQLQKSSCSLSTSVVGSPCWHNPRMPFWRRRKPPLTDTERQWREHAPQIQAAQEERARRLVGREDQVASIERLLFDRDPIGINFECNADEYRPEAETIILRSPEASTGFELLRIIYEGLSRGLASLLPDRRVLRRDRFRNLGLAPRGTCLLSADPSWGCPNPPVGAGPNRGSARSRYLANEAMDLGDRHFGFAHP